MTALLALIAAIHFGLLLIMLCGKWSNDGIPSNEVEPVEKTYG